MNDTFDDFTFRSIKDNTVNKPNLGDFSPVTAVPYVKELDKNSGNDSKNIKSDISFDDSLFLNTQELTILKRSENSVNTTRQNEPNENTLDSKNDSDLNDIFEQFTLKLTQSSEKSQQSKNETQQCESNAFFNCIFERSALNEADQKSQQTQNKHSGTFERSSPNESSEKSQQCKNETQKNENYVKLPKPDFNHMVKLSSWGLPDSILEKYTSRNVTTMFPWQVECLNNPKIIKQHANLVYSAPTSAGKTLVAEMLAIKTVLERSKKVIFILPFVSVVREKMFYFQDIFSGSGVRVEGFMGSYNPPGGFQSVQFAVCTIEKANSLINSFLREGTLADIGAVIIDEMHLLGESHRGYLLELLLTKLRYVSLKDSLVDLQIIGMSATLPNLEVLAQWLEAELYVTNFRPIPLYEQAHFGGAIYDTEFTIIRKISPLSELDADTDNILQLCLETIKDNCSVLIFCPTKNWCENLAQQISTAFYKLGSGTSPLSQELRQQLNSDSISELLEQLKFCPVGLDGVLRKTVSFGVAFHHAGLTLDERDIIEGAFRNGVIRVLVATSTLSSGVNLPARRVIIRTPIFHGKPLDALTYRQMIGRAGRMGKDTAGESILVCQKSDEKIARSLMSAKLQPIESCLEGEGKLKRAILEVVASGVASSPHDVQLFAKCTLLAQSETFENPIEDALDFLVTNEFVRLQEQDGVKKYVASSLGRACLSSSIPPEDGLALFTELEKARQCFVLETELHLIYLVTPYSATHQWGNIDWMFYLSLWEKLPASMKKVGELVGVRESYIISATRGKLQTNTSKLYHKYLVHKRFFVSLALQDLVNEKPLSEVCSKFNCNRGMLQSLQLTASTFAGMVTSFSKQLGWSSVEILISQFQDRLHFGVSRELLDLMKLPILNGKCARALFNGGLETLVQLANSHVDTIENVLHKVMPFESGKMREGESEFALKERNKFKNIWITGKEGLTEREAAELLLTSARDYLKIEMGLKEAKWEKNVILDCSSSKEKTVEEVLTVSKTEQSKQRRSLNISGGSDLFAPLNQQNNDVPLKEVLSTSSEEKEPRLSLNISASSDMFSPFKQQNGHANQSLTSDGSLFETSLSEETPPKFDLCSTKNTLLTISMNSSGDFVMTSQDESCISYKEKTPKPSRKRPKRGKENRFFLQQQSPRKKTKISREHQENVSEIEMVDVCSHEQLYSTFCIEAKGQQLISLAVACAEVEEKKRIIGLTPDSADTSQKFTYKNRRVDGFAVFWGGSTTYYLNLEKMEKCVEFIKLLVSNKHLTIVMFDCKEQIKVLKRCCGVNFRAKVEDPKISDWLLEPEGSEKSLQAMVQVYCPTLSKMLRFCGISKNVGSPSLDCRNLAEPKMRSSVESFLTWHLIMVSKKELLQQNKTLSNVFTTEMTCLRLLAQMELTGIAINKASLTQLVHTLTQEQITLEKKAYTLAGRRFSFTSTRDVAKVLGLFNGQRGSTKKQVLKKNENPISQLVLQWRKINCTITKMIQPLIRSVENGRIHGCCVMHTATGRITMHEPNLQNVAKDFDIEGAQISCRDAFVPTNDHVFISADYCQLELRLLAHLSQDEVLCRIMRGKGDVFKSVAARWNRIKEHEVTDVLRQHAKQICYGIIYGMGSRTLADHLSVDEKQASVFMDTFKAAYPGVQNYLREVVEKCKKNGFVETLAGRKRYLPNINSKNGAVRRQAERQAVNTTIQGSAADIVKTTMVGLDEICWAMKDQPKLVLHLHDELLFEVKKSGLRIFATVLKKTMEETVKLSIPFPVKVKAGPSWGQLTEYNV